ncbi:9033_t:CDS:2, partial [Racocetra persica]
VEDTDRQYDHLYQDDCVAVIAIILGHVNLCACLCLIYSAFSRWRASSLSISTRIPLYFSILEVCQSFNIGGISNSILYLMNEGIPSHDNLRPISERIHTTITTKIERLSTFNTSTLSISPKSITVPMAVFIPSIFNPDNPTFGCDSIYGINLNIDDYNEKQQQSDRDKKNRYLSDTDSSIQTDTSDIEEEIYLAIRR